MKQISIIGAGAWGTALATVANGAGLDVVIQALEEDVARAVNTSHENALYLPGVTLDAAIRATTDLADACEHADALILAPPSQFMRLVLESLKPYYLAGIPLIICAKGIEQETGALMSEVVQDVLAGAPVAILTGATFDAEVVHGLPSGVTLATKDEALGVRLSEALSTPRFRLYRSDDLIGAQIGGTVKNVLAIACGIVEGRGFGDNTRAALITRGLAEIVREGFISIQIWLDRLVAALTHWPVPRARRTPRLRARNNPSSPVRAPDPCCRSLRYGLHRGCG